MEGGADGTGRTKLAEVSLDCDAGFLSKFHLQLSANAVCVPVATFAVLAGRQGGFGICSVLETILRL